MKSLFLLVISGILTTALIATSVVGVHWDCAQNADCADVPQAFCAIALGECRCPAGHTFAGNVTVCVPESLNGEPCDEDGQCAHMLTGAHCSANGVCECVDGYTYIRGRCRQLQPLHGRCNEAADCFFGYDRESVACVEDTCQCTLEYYQRTENICRRKSMNAGDPCVVHEDCVGEQLFCNDFKLECEVSNVAAVATQTAGSSASSSGSSSSRGSSNSIIHNGRRDASTSTEQTKKESPGATTTARQTQTSESSANDGGGGEEAKFGDACVQTANEPCPGLPHSECVLAQCRCRRGYYADRYSGRCMAEIGEVASAAHLCSGDSMNATTGRCVCGHNRFALAHLRECIKPGFGLGYSCTEAAQCSPFGASFCPGPNAPPGTRVCTCHPYAQLDEARQLCVPRRGLGAQCTVTADCATQTPDAVCDSSVQLCVCRPNYVPTEEGAGCAPGVTAACQTDDECAPENAECASDGRCACRPGFVHVGEQCLTEATAFEDPCIADEQCQPLLGERGKCIDAQCKCEAHLQHSNGQCNRIRALDESCTAAAECHVTIEPENVVCRNGACGCKFGTHKDTAKLVCRKNSSSRISALKAITLLLIAAAVGVTTAAIHDAYY